MVVSSSEIRHPSAVISSQAQLADDVVVGPYCTIGDDVRIGSGCCLDSHVVLEGPTTIGSNNRFFPVLFDRDTGAGSEI